MRKHGAQFNKQLESNRKDVLRTEEEHASAIIGSKHTLSLGDLTRRLLKRKGIKSPETVEKIQLKPGLWVCPKEPFKNDAERQAYILEMKHKYGCL